MDIKKTDRTALKSYFVKNAVPTQSNFADLIDGVINQKEDGIAKLPGEPVSLQADGNDTSQKKVINFYKDFADPKPAWTISLNPRVNPNDAMTAKPGLSVGDADGNSKLFIDQSTGNVGIGSVTPTSTLQVRKDVRGALGPVLSLTNGGAAAGAGAAIDFSGFDTQGQPAAARILSLDDGNYSSHLAFSTKKPGANANPLVESLRITSSGNIGIGTDGPRAKLEVRSGAIMPSVGNGATAGIQFPSDPGGGSGDSAWLRYYVRQGEACTLELGINNDADDHIALMSSGNVGIGTNNPANKLDVSGDIAVQGKHAIRGNDTWLRLNQDGKFTNGTHTPGLFAPMSLNVGGVNGWGNPGNGNVIVSGSIACGGKIWIRTYHNTNAKYLGVRPEGSVYGGPNKDIWESFTLEMGCSRDIKENIAALSEKEAMATLQHLSPVKYDYKGERLFRQNLGFIAEDMPDNLASENRKTISPFEVTPILTKVAQEQQKALLALQEKIDLLQEEVKRQKSQIEKLSAACC